MKKKIGEQALELAKKSPETRDPIELQREMHKKYESELLEVLQEGKSKYSDDFYLVVLYKKERLLPNVIRAFFFNRLSCPTPDYDQTVYKYHKKDDYLEFLWVIPSKDTCEMFMENILQVEEKEVLQFVLEFYDGTLLLKAKKLNKEIST